MKYIRCRCYCSKIKSTRKKKASLNKSPYQKISHPQSTDINQLQKNKINHSIKITKPKQASKQQHRANHDGRQESKQRSHRSSSKTDKRQNALIVLHQNLISSYYSIKPGIFISNLHSNIPCKCWKIPNWKELS